MDRGNRLSQQNGRRSVEHGERIKPAVSGGTVCRSSSRMQPPGTP